MSDEWGRSFYRPFVKNLTCSAAISCLTVGGLILLGDLLLHRFHGTAYGNLLLFRMLSMGKWTTVGFLILGLLVFARVMLAFERKNLLYMERIAGAIQGISEGDLLTPMEVVGENEFAAMASDLNRMQEEIRSLIDKEREAERTKNELIVNVAHDLRTPLTSIIGYLELLSSGPKASVQTQEKYIDIAYAKSKRLEKLIEDLFGLTKMSYGKLPMNVGNLDIVKLLGQLLEEFYPSFADKDMTYELTSNVPSQTIRADGNLIARLFDNLINNAIKYGSDGKKILVRVTAQEKTVTVEVINYGNPIPERELPLIFQKFYRVEQSRSRKTGGTGLGLAIAKSIVDMHGGEIGVSSDAKGTVFTVNLQIDFDGRKDSPRQTGKSFW